MPELIQVQEILKGYRVDKDHIQSVGNMTMVPIVSDVEFTNVADANQITLKHDLNYGSLEFQNSGGQIGIAIQGWALIDNNQRAQDRTIPYAHLIKAANSKIIPANCIQHTQPGTFDSKKVNQNSFMVLPPSLRGIALKSQDFNTAGQIGALWPSLKTWVKGVDCDSRGLTSFFTQFEDKLDQFVAQFEPVEKQLGAIILINGQIVSIDIMPKYDSWKYVWRALIRDSYGAEAVRSAQNEGSTNIHPTINLENLNDIENLENAFNQMKTDFYSQLQSLIGNTVSMSLGYKILEKVSELSLIKLESNEFVGQAVTHGDEHFVYLSLVNTKAKTTNERKKFTSLRTNPYGTTDFRFN